MGHAITEEPVAAERAFREDSSAAIQSRAAILLLLGRQALGRTTTVADRVAEAPSEATPVDDSLRLQVPTLDLVILLDRGGQTFRSPGIEEHKLPIWFQHSATHEPDVWQRYDLKNWLKL